MAGNASLQKAKAAKADEFYTRREDIESELFHYARFFDDKIVYCNCDDPKTSEFWRFFVRNFIPWNLKKLIATHYEPCESVCSYKLELARGMEGRKRVGDREPVLTRLPCNGDFRSSACIELLEEADIVVTNPPFSLFREYITQLVERGKKFVVIAPFSGLKYRETFPFFKENKIWLGYTSPKLFRVPIGSTGRSVFVENGVSYQKFGNVCWITNFDIAKRHEEIDLRGNYYDPARYPSYTNFDGIDVASVSDIPCDYEGFMGVPISFMTDYNPDQFEIVGLGEGNLAKEIGITRNARGRTDLEVQNPDGTRRRPWARIVIKRKGKVSDNED